MFLNSTIKSDYINYHFKTYFLNKVTALSLSCWAQFRQNFLYYLPGLLPQRGLVKSKLQNNKTLLLQSPRARRILSTVYHTFYTAGFLPYHGNLLFHFSQETKEQRKQMDEYQKFCPIYMINGLLFDKEYSVKQALKRDPYAPLSETGFYHLQRPTQPNKNHNRPESLLAIYSWANPIDSPCSLMVSSFSQKSFFFIQWVEKKSEVPQSI